MKDEAVSDEDIVTLCLSGHMELFRRLVQRYEDMLYDFVYKFTRDVDRTADIVQDTFIKVWQNLNKFHLNSKFKSWIFTIARNTALDELNYFNEKNFTPFSKFEDEDGNISILETTADISLQPDVLLEQRELHRLLNGLIDGTKPQFRSVLELHYGRGYHFDEIANTLDIPLNTALTWHHRGIQAMKKMFQERR